MATLQLELLPSVSAAAMAAASRIRATERDRERQRMLASRESNEVLLATLIQQWASSLARWMKSRQEADRRAMTRAVERCNALASKRSSARLSGSPAIDVAR